jgi:hypothetical protein
MVKRSCRDLFEIVGKWLGYILNYYLKPGVFVKICGLRVNYGKRQGVLHKVAGIFQLKIYFQIENPVDRVHGAWTGWCGSSPSWTEQVQTSGPGGALPVHGR